ADNALGYAVVGPEECEAAGIVGKRVPLHLVREPALGQDSPLADEHHANRVAVAGLDEHDRVDALFDKRQCGFGAGRSEEQCRDEQPGQQLPGSSLVSCPSPLSPQSHDITRSARSTSSSTKHTGEGLLPLGIEWMRARIERSPPPKGR